MHVLVTGGAGYIGSVLCPILLTHRHRVTAVDNFMHGQMSLAGICSHPSLRIVSGDVRDGAIMRSLEVDADVVIPLAAIVGTPACSRDKLAANSTNAGAIGTMRTRLRPEQRIIIPITNSGYGIGRPGVECTEETPLRPVSHYGDTKVLAEQFAMAHGNTVALRLATVFGMSPRMRLDLLVNDFVHRAYFDKSLVLFEAGFKRNYIHVRDVVGAMIHVLGNWDQMKNQVYNVGLSSANLSKRELAEKIREYVPELVILEAETGQDPDKRDYIVSNAKIEATGWEPGYTLDLGILELLKGCQMMRRSQYGNA